MKMFIHSRRWLLVMLASSLLGGTLVFAAETASEQAARAALLFNFIKFTEWPAATGRPQLHLCIATRDQVQIDAFEELGTRQVRGKPLATIRYSKHADCDVLYVDSRQRWLSIAEEKVTPHTLTIGGYAGFAADGGMIEIVLQEGGARFDINLAAAKRAELRFYPQLLKLARRIVE
jgi:hypothetical protein